MSDRFKFIWPYLQGRSEGGNGATGIAICVQQARAGT